MVSALLDTATVIDLIRGYDRAVQWLSQESHMIGLTKFVWMEVIAGCENKIKVQEATHLLERFELISLDSQDVDWALDQLTLFNLSHNIDPFDCLIAAPSYRLQIPLYTRNLKHFRPLLSKLAQTPY